jgi:hypothetical protein
VSRQLTHENHWDELFRKYQLDSIYQDDLEKVTVVSSFFSE